MELVGDEDFDWRDKVVWDGGDELWVGGVVEEELEGKKIRDRNEGKVVEEEMGMLKLLMDDR